MATEEIYKFLKDQNRPFVISDIMQNISKDHGKTAVQKALDKLTAKNYIIEKCYGKQKLYCILQPDCVATSENEETIRKLDREISSLSSNVSTLEEQLMQTANEIKSLRSQMTTEDAELENNKLHEEISKLKAKLEVLTGNSKLISDEEKHRISTENVQFLKEYRKRKRICFDITDAILEGYPKSKKELFEDIGIETDEDVGFTVD